MELLKGLKEMVEGGGTAEREKSGAEEERPRFVRVRKRE